MKSPDKSAFFTHTLISNTPSQNLQKTPIFRHYLELHSKSPKYHPIPLLITPTQVSPNKKSLENKVFLLLSSISISNSSEHHFVKS